MILALFSLNELNRGPSELSGGSLVCKEKFLQSHMVKIENIKQLTGRLPDPGEAYFLWTLKSFNAFSFIPYMIKEQGQILELVLSTYSITQRILDAFVRYRDKGLIDQVHLLISDSVKFRLPLVNERLIQLNEKGFRVIYGWNHSKITLVQTSLGYFVIEGSGNFSENAQFEQYLFLNSPIVYEFRKNCITNINHDLFDRDLNGN